MVCRNGKTTHHFNERGRSRRKAHSNRERKKTSKSSSNNSDCGWGLVKEEPQTKSGVAIIIGRETKRLLFLGIRNQYCSTCSIAHNCNKSVPPHKCYKNWTESSCAMQSDILVAGFRASEATHGVRYMEVIGDGDSSVLAAIRSQVIWGPYVQKLECANQRR